MGTATTTIILSNTQHWFQLVPIDWNGVAAIATLGAIVAAISIAFFQHRNDKKQEMLTRLVVFKNQLDDHIRWMPGISRFNFFREIEDFKKDAPLVYAHIPSRLKRQMDDFYIRSRRVNLLCNQIYQALKNIIVREFQAKINEKQFSVNSLDVPSGDEFMNAHYSFNVGGQHYAATLFHLLMSGETLGEYITEKMSDQSLPNQIVSNESGSVTKLNSLSRAQFETVVQSARAHLKEDDLLNQCVIEYTALYKAGKILLEKLNTWLLTP